MWLEAHQLELLRRRFALTQLSLPDDEFPNLVASADDAAEVWLSDPDRWWRNTVDLITFGLERMLERSREDSVATRSDGGPGRFLVTETTTAVRIPHPRAAAKLPAACRLSPARCH